MPGPFSCHGQTQDTQVSAHALHHMYHLLQIYVNGRRYWCAGTPFPSRLASDLWGWRWIFHKNWQACGAVCEFVCAEGFIYLSFWETNHQCVERYKNTEFWLVIFFFLSLCFSHRSLSADTPPTTCFSGPWHPPTYGPSQGPVACWGQWLFAQLAWFLWRVESLHKPLSFSHLFFMLICFLFQVRVHAVASWRDALVALMDLQDLADRPKVPLLWQFMSLKLQCFNLCIQKIEAF